ncbi:Origin recognition complex subunit 5 [Hyphodiscus hymeniophilus]|uniref:Origin recognition complex subunit 5 n=1 Tax=Hyphodiscus hymeniophilus TaxID=353542 RepID=A0A9P7AW66_9HELO|nr:Origin recognition complex subunit 5 [Hyphodiscus hymeniophilus]
MSKSTDSVIGNITLSLLLQLRAAPAKNIVIYGLEATGKSAIAKAVLEGLSSNTTSNDEPNGELRYVIVRSAECIGVRHLLEQIVGAVAKALDWKGSVGRCENISQLVVELERLLGQRTSDTEGQGRRLVLVFDGIDHQRDAPPTLLPGLARLSEVIPNITSLFIVTAPRPNFLHSPGAPQIQFQAYNKDELLKILALLEPQPQLPGGAKETKDMWNRFCSAVWDSLSKHSGRDLVSFRTLCLRLWPKFVAPILDGSLAATPFGRVMNANRPLFQNDETLVPGISYGAPKIAASSAQTQSTNKHHGIGTQLPYYSRLLLVAAYLASFNPPRTDQLFFMKSAAAKRRKKGGGTALTKGRPGVTKHRKISRKLLGPQAFILERMLAIFHAIKEDADDRGRRGTGREVTAGSADIQMAIATLASLRLLVRMGAANAADALDGGSKYRVAVGWDVVRGIARSVGVEAEDYLAE